MKKILIAAAVAVASVSLTACGDTTTSNNTVQVDANTVTTNGQ